MVINQQCRGEIIRFIESKLPPRGVFGVVRNGAINTTKFFIEPKIRQISQAEYNLTFEQFVNKKYPEYKNRLNELPPCIRKYSVGECVNLYNEMKDSFH